MSLRRADRITSLLRRKYRQLPITRVIVETDKPKQLFDIVERFSLIHSITDLKILGKLRALLSSISIATDDLGEAMLRLRVIPRFSMASFIATAKTIEDMAQQKQVKKIYLDRMMNILSIPPIKNVYKDRSGVLATTTAAVAKYMGATTANAKGITGKGVKVAVLDTLGTIPTHPAVRHVKGFSTITGSHIDFNSHGIWVASAISGKPFIDRVNNVLTHGLAPDALTIAIRCLGFLIGIGLESDIIQAIELADRLDADIINMSLGSDERPDTIEEDPQAQVIRKLATEKNRIFCVASGNSGPGVIGSPSATPEAITVGALTLQGTRAGFSSYGEGYNGVSKPDVSCPGVSINAPAFGLLDIVTDGMPQLSSPMDGTSMATPICTAMIALMMQDSIKTLGKKLTRDMFLRMMQEKGLGYKDPEIGWGVPFWHIWEEFKQTLT